MLIPTAYPDLTQWNNCTMVKIIFDGITSLGLCVFVQIYEYITDCKKFFIKTFVQGFSFPEVHIVCIHFFCYLRRKYSFIVCNDCPIMSHLSKKFVLRGLLSVINFKRNRPTKVFGSHQWISILYHKSYWWDGFLMLSLLESPVQALQESTTKGFGERSEKGDAIHHCNNRRPTQELSSLVISPLVFYQLTNVKDCTVQFAVWLFFFSFSLLLSDM